MIQKALAEKIIAVFKESRSFFITGHIRPDGDTIGSELAVASWLKNIDASKQVDVIHKDPVPENLLFLKGARNITVSSHSSGTYDAGIIFECPDLKRTGNIFDISSLKKIVNIDHHSNCGKEIEFGDYNYIDAKASSCAEIVWRIMSVAGYQPVLDEAICLYTGLITDTGMFQQPNTSYETLQVAADLMKTGIDPAYMYGNIYCTKSIASIKGLSEILSTLTLDDSISYMTIEGKLLNNPDINLLETNDIIKFAEMIPEARVYVLFRESVSTGTVRVNLRSRESSIGLDSVALHFGGGGHKNAAGCEIQGTVAEAKEKVLSLIKKQL